MAKFNHIVRNIPNTKENRQQIKAINKIASKSDSKWRLHIKYRQPKDGKQWGWGGTLRSEDADGFSVYMKNIVPWSEREEVVQSREIGSKYNKLLNKYNNLIMKQIIAKLKEDVDSYDLCSDERVDVRGWRNVQSSLDNLMANVENGYKELESY